MSDKKKNFLTFQCLFFYPKKDPQTLCEFSARIVGWAFLPCPVTVPEPRRDFARRAGFIWGEQQNVPTFWTRLTSSLGTDSAGRKSRSSGGMKNRFASPVFLKHESCFICVYNRDSSLEVSSHSFSSRYLHCGNYLDCQLPHLDFQALIKTNCKSSGTPGLRSQIGTPAVSRQAPCAYSAHASPGLLPATPRNITDKQRTPALHSSGQRGI